jgi:hypothetical protein
MRLLGFDISFSRASRVKLVPTDAYAVESSVLELIGSGSRGSIDHAS